MSLERALEKLYEDADVRDELRDPEAQLLLQWADARLTQLASGAADDAFDEQADALRGLLKAINRFVGRRAELDADARRTQLAAMTDQARALGAAPTGEQIDALLQQLDTLDDAAALQAVTALFNAAPAESAPVLAAPAAPPPSAIQVASEPDPTLKLLTHSTLQGESKPDDETQNDDLCP